MIENLSKKGLAYQGKNGDVFYSVRNFKEYGKLSGKNLDDLMAGARVDIESNKKDPLDFVLWKKANRMSPNGHHLGVMEGLAGILNVLPCQIILFLIILTYTVAVWI